MSSSELIDALPACCSKCGATSKARPLGVTPLHWSREYVGGQGRYYCPNCWHPTARSHNRADMEALAAEWTANDERQGRARRWEPTKDCQSPWAWTIVPVKLNAQE